MTSRGIDYGLGQTNIDRETGIRYGVISQHEVLQAWSDSSEPDYGNPCCPKCGNDAVDLSDDDSDTDREDYTTLRRHECHEYACDSCRLIFGGESAYGESPLGFYLDDGEYKASAGEDGDIFILSSPYFTRAAFCSPCAPGACYLTSPCDDGERAYCFGHDWFDDGKAPYPVYSVATGEEVPCA